MKPNFPKGNVLTLLLYTDLKIRWEAYRKEIV